MKYVLKVKFSGVTYNSLKKIYFTKKLKCIDVDFTDEIMTTFLINGVEYKQSYTAIQKADNWLSNQSKILTDIIDKKDLKCIINWEIISINNAETKKVKLSEPEKLGLILNSFNKDYPEEFKNNFSHTYLLLEKSLKGISTEQKISIILAVLGIAIDASSTAYKHMIDILNGNFNIKQLKCG